MCLYDSIGRSLEVEGTSDVNHEEEAFSDVFYAVPLDLLVSNLRT